MATTSGRLPLTVQATVHPTRGTPPALESPPTQRHRPTRHTHPTKSSPPARLAPKSSDPTTPREKSRLITTTTSNDDRVHAGHARKMAAALRDLGHRVLFYENTERGHAGVSNNAQAAFESALEYEFLHSRLSPATAASTAATLARDW